MSLTRKAIRAKIVELLTGETDAEDRVYPSRVVPVWEEKLPAILVYTLSDTREIFSQPKRYVVDLQLRIEIIQKVSTAVDDELDVLGSQVEYILDQDFTLGNLVEEITHHSTEMAFDKEGDRMVGSLILTFACRYYRDSVTDGIRPNLQNLEQIHTDWIPNSPTGVTLDTEDDIEDMYPPLETPISFGVTLTSATSLTLTWEDVELSGSVLIERSLDGLTGWAEIAEVLTGVETYLDSGLPTDVTQYYRIRATDSFSNHSPYSEILNGTPEAE